MAFSAKCIGLNDPNKIRLAGTPPYVIFNGLSAPLHLQIIVFMSVFSTFLYCLLNMSNMVYFGIVRLVHSLLLAAKLMLVKGPKIMSFVLANGAKRLTMAPLVMNKG